MEQERTYVCIDLKSFYASVECVARGLDPMTTKLVVADPTRSEMTICLAVSPAMKAAGVRNRCRLHEIPKGMEFITARPRMKTYMQVSADIYATYLRYVSPDDIHPYSIDECFINATPYMELYAMDARSFADALRAAVKAETGIPATAGIGPNLYLCKIAMDIWAKRIPADKNGVRIAQLVAYGERGFRKRILRGFAGERQVLVVNGDRFSAVTDNVHDLLREVRFERTVGERSLNKCNSRLVCHVSSLRPRPVAWWSCTARGAVNCYPSWCVRARGAPGNSHK